MGNGPNAPTRLCCEFVKDPLGVNKHPTFSWWVTDARPAELQSAYEIQAASTSDRLADDAADLWLSGRIEGWENAHVPYQGLPLISGQQVSWRVRTYDSDGAASPWSAVAQFEMGLLTDREFGGEWISAGLSGNRHASVAVGIVRHDFELTELPVLARLHVALKGQAKILVNGQQIADLQPQWIDYAHRHPCYTVDVTSALKAGMNSLLLLLADGLYAGLVPTLGREIFGESSQIKVFLRTEGESGRKSEVGSGYDWRWQPSWIGSAEWLRGDCIDLRRKAITMSDQAPLSDWARVIVQADTGSQGMPVLPMVTSVRPVSPTGGPIRRLITSSTGPHRIVSVVDFAEVVFGRALVTLSGKAVDLVKIRYFLDAEGPLSEDQFTTCGDGKQEFLQSEIAQHCFTSVEVEYSVRTTLVEAISALADEPEIERENIVTDHATLNKLIVAMQQARQVAMQSAPLRGLLADERFPDIGFASTWIEPLAIDPANYAMLSKWLSDARSTSLGDVGPYDGGREPLFADQDEFARFETLLVLSQSLFRYQNAQVALRDTYPQLRAMALSYRHHAEDLLRRPRPDLYGVGEVGVLVATARFHSHLLQLAEIARLLNEHADHKILLGLAEQVKEAFRRRFVTADGHVVTDATSALLAVLHWRMLREEEEPRVQLELLDRVQGEKYQVDVVPAVVAGLLPEITRAGRLDMAYMVLLQTTPTSWMGHVLADKKLTYAKQRPDIAQCGVWDWLVENLLGMTLPRELDSEETGLRHIVIRPKPPLGAQFQAGAPINHVAARMRSLYGEYGVSWQIGERSFVLELMLPPSCSAEVELPDGVIQRVSSGRHRFALEYSRGGDGVPILREVAIS